MENDYLDEMENSPSEDDMFITPCGQLGGMLSVSVEGRFLGEFAEYTDAENAIRDYMEKSNFYPNIWYVSDHGNVSPYTLERIG